MRFAAVWREALVGKGRVAAREEPLNEGRERPPHLGTLAWRGDETRRDAIRFVPTPACLPAYLLLDRRGD